MRAHPLSCLIAGPLVVINLTQLTNALSLFDVLKRVVFVIHPKQKIVSLVRSGVVVVRNPKLQTQIAAAGNRSAKSFLVPQNPRRQADSSYRELDEDESSVAAARCSRHEPET